MHITLQRVAVQQNSTATLDQQLARNRVQIERLQNYEKELLDELNQSNALEAAPTTTHELYITQRHLREAIAENTELEIRVNTRNANQTPTQRIESPNSSSTNRTDIPRTTSPHLDGHSVPVIQIFITNRSHRQSLLQCCPIRLDEHHEHYQNIHQ